MADRDDNNRTSLASFAEQATLKLYTFGREMRQNFPEASGRMGAFFGKIGKMGHFMRRDGWSSFTESVCNFGEKAGEMYMKATSTRAGAIATGVAGGLGVLGVYYLTPLPVLAVVVGVTALAGSFVSSAWRGIGHAVAGAEASSDIAQERDWERRGYGGNRKTSWLDYGREKRDNLDNELLSPDDQAHGWHRQEESEGKNWLEKRPSAVGRAHLPLAAANLVMWGTNPAGLVVAAACILGPEGLVRGIGKGISAVHFGMDTIRALGHQVSEGIDGARAKIAEKDARAKQAAELATAGDADAGKKKVQTVEFTDTGMMP